MKCSHCGGTGEEPPANGYTAQALEVLGYLNIKTGRQYRPVAANLDLIAQRLRSGATVVQCKAIVSRKVADWGDDPKMAEFLRPQTLFARGKFESYLGQLPASAFKGD